MTLIIMNLPCFLAPCDGLTLQLEEDQPEHVVMESLCGVMRSTEKRITDSLRAKPPSEDWVSALLLEPRSANRLYGVVPSELDAHRR